MPQCIIPRRPPVAVRSSSSCLPLYCSTVCLLGGRAAGRCGPHQPASTSQPAPATSSTAAGPRAAAAERPRPPPRGPRRQPSRTTTAKDDEKKKPRRRAAETNNNKAGSSKAPPPAARARQEEEEKERGVRCAVGGGAVRAAVVRTTGCLAWLLTGCCLCARCKAAGGAAAHALAGGFFPRQSCWSCVLTQPAPAAAH